LRSRGALCLPPNRTDSNRFGKDAEARSSDQGRFHGVLEKPEVSFPVPAALFWTISVEKQVDRTGKVTSKVDLVSIWLGLPDCGNRTQLGLYEQQ